MRSAAMPIASITFGLSLPSTANSVSSCKRVLVLLASRQQDRDVVPDDAREVLVFAEPDLARLEQVDHCRVERPQLDLAQALERPRGPVHRLLGHDGRERGEGGIEPAELVERRAQVPVPSTHFRLSWMACRYRPTASSRRPASRAESAFFASESKRSEVAVGRGLCGPAAPGCAAHTGSAANSHTSDSRHTGPSRSGSRRSPTSCAVARGMPPFSAGRPGCTAWRSCSRLWGLCLS